MDNNSLKFLKFKQYVWSAYTLIDIAETFFINSGDIYNVGKFKQIGEQMKFVSSGSEVFRNCINYDNCVDDVEKIEKFINNKLSHESDYIKFLSCISISKAYFNAVNSLNMDLKITVNIATIINTLNNIIKLSEFDSNKVYFKSDVFEKIDKISKQNIK